MLTNVKAVIFDMDGVIIDSEPLWRRAMITSFNSIGIPFTDEDCRITTGMRFIEVAEYWLKTHNITTVVVSDFDNLVIDSLCKLIKTEGKLMPGVKITLDYLKQHQFKIGLATSSNIKLMNTVLEHLNIRHYFDSVCSAQHLKFGKPHPEVFINCANKLNTLPVNCLVIEDSLNGLIAAKAAQMKVLVVPDEENKNNPKFIIADYYLNSLTKFVF